MPEGPTIDAELGEVLRENEVNIAQEISDFIAAKIKGGPRPALRDAHPKAHGCVQAEFNVEHDLPAHLAQGILVPGKSYPAWIRFSNGDFDATKPDADGDARGMAIKLLNVPGEKILPDERDAQTHDFIMINHPVFFVDDPASYLALIHRTGSSNPLAKVGSLGPRTKGAVIAHEITSSQIISPFETRYWSMVPYRLGDPPRQAGHQILRTTTASDENTQGQAHEGRTSCVRKWLSN